MKVVIISNYELGNETGSAKVAEDLANKLSNKNKVLLLCLGSKFRIYEKNKNLEILEVTSLVIKDIYIPIITPILMYQVFKKLDEFKPDIIHAQNSILVSSLTQIWSRLNSTPFVVTFHHVPSEPIKHLVPHLSKNMLLNLVQEIYKNTSLKQFLKKSDLAIAQNKIIYDSIRTIDNDIKIETINNGIEISELNKIKPRKYNGKYNFVFLGSFNPRKNQIFLINTFKYLPKRFNLYLYGSFKTGGEYLDKVRNLVKKNKLTNVFLKDFEPDIKSVFERSDYLVSSSKKEAQSLVIIQALASGKPVIGLANETIDELITNKNGLCVSKKTTPSRFAREIIKFVEKSNYKKLSLQAIKDSKRFDINIVISKIEKCYQRLTNSRG